MEIRTESLKISLDIRGSKANSNVLPVVFQSMLVIVVVLKAFGFETNLRGMKSAWSLNGGGQIWLYLKLHPTFFLKRQSNLPEVYCPFPNLFKLKERDRQDVFFFLSAHVDMICSRLQLMNWLSWLFLYVCQVLLSEKVERPCGF